MIAEPLRKNPAPLPGIAHAARGFTLLEILTVVVILAILLGLVFAGYSRAMDAALGVKNLSNHRIIAQGIRAYAQDFQGRLPYGNDYDPPFGNGASSAPNSYSPYPKTLCVMGYVSDGSVFFSPRFWPRWSNRDATQLIIHNPSKYLSVVIPWGYTNYGANRYGAMPIWTDGRKPARLPRVAADGNLSKLIFTRDTYNPAYDQAPSMLRGGGVHWFANEGNLPSMEDCYGGMVHASFADGHAEAFPRATMIEMMRSSTSAPLFNEVYTRQ